MDAKESDRWNCWSLVRAQRFRCSSTSTIIANSICYCLVIGRLRGLSGPVLCPLWDDAADSVVHNAFSPFRRLTIDSSTAGFETLEKMLSFRWIIAAGEQLQILECARRAPADIIQTQCRRGLGQRPPYVLQSLILSHTRAAHGRARTTRLNAVDHSHRVEITRCAH